MKQTMATVLKERTGGDTAVDGIFAGMAAGVLMAVYLVVSGWLGGVHPADVMARFSPPGNSSAWLGVIGHLATASAYGIIFALGYRFLARTPVLPLLMRFQPWQLGTAYGLLLLLAAEILFLPAIDSPLLEIPVVHFAAGHLVYGLALGLLISRALTKR